MTYLPNIPLPGDLLSVSQGNIKDNFTQANIVMGINHYPFDNATANKGKHKVIDMPVQTTPLPVLGEGKLYCQAGGFNSEAQLFWQFAGVNHPLQITGTQFNTGVTNGYVPLMNGMMLQWGVINTGTLNQNTTVLFATNNIDFQTNCFIVLPILINDGATTNAQTISVTKNSVSKLGFSVNYTGGSAYRGFYWIALGN